MSKFRAFMKISLLPSSVLVALSVLVSPAHAEKADRNKPMNIEADLLRYDDVRQISVFSGNVVLTKGSIVIRAAQIDVRQDADGYQFGSIVGTPEKPAFYRQKREGLDEFIEGESEMIEYDGRADTVKFVRKAQLRRLRGALLADEISGALIVYENLTDKFTVDGSAAKGPGTAPAAGRVRAMLTPKPEETVSSPAVKREPAAPLRASNSLGSAPK